jgi:hypothetical protein
MSSQRRCPGVSCEKRDSGDLCPTQTSSSPFLDNFPFADKDEAAGAADATAWMSPGVSGTFDVVWVTEKGDSRDPFTQDDAGGTPAPQLF